MPVNAIPCRRPGIAGFTLVELLVTLVIVSVGMLGLVKMEAAGVSESQVSRTRSLMIFQAESLAGVMRANRGFWAARTAPFPSFSVPSTGTPYAYPSTATPGTDPACQTSSCTPAQLAYADLTTWANGFSAAFPGSIATITCTAPTGAACNATAVVPTSYDIKLTWHEKSVAINRNAAGTNDTGGTSMVLHVQP